MSNLTNLDGWLGIIIGSKIYYKFTDPNQFEAKFSSLLKEINSYTHDSQQAIQTHKNIDSKKPCNLKLGIKIYLILLSTYFHDYVIIIYLRHTYT